MHTTRTPGDAAIGAGSVRITVKVSPRWNSGDYRFQAVGAVRTERVALLGVSPETLDLWIVPEAEAARRSDRGATGWVTVEAGNPPGRLAAHHATGEHARKLGTGPAAAL